MTTAFLPVQFVPPLLNPSPTGLFAATVWRDTSDPLRWLPDGVQVETWNFGGAFGVWEADWCAEEGDLDAGDVKRGFRPEFPDAFQAMTLWGADECDMTRASRTEVEARAQHNLRMNEQVAAETAVGTRLVTDAGAADTAADIVEAVGLLEAALSLTSTTGLIHASAGLAAAAANAQLITRSGAKLLTPLGHQWVFGGGYVTTLDQTLVATSQTFGWRGEAQLRATPELKWNQYRAVAERALVIGYEAAVGAATIS